MVPIIQWLPRYKNEKLVGDAIAGITVGLMVIPQGKLICPVHGVRVSQAHRNMPTGLAYANLAGLPPVYGLYSSFMGAFMYAIFGTAKDVSVGPTALMSLIVAEAFTEVRLQ